VKLKSFWKSFQPLAFNPCKSSEFPERSSAWRLSASVSPTGSSPNSSSSRSSSSDSGSEREPVDVQELE
jgi:hypothetical protein